VRRRRGTLVYIGVHRGGSFDQIFRKYAMCHAFEPNPDLFAKLVRKYGHQSNVRLINAAVAQQNGEVTLNISSNDAASSSLGNFDERYDGYRSGIRMVTQVKVRSVNLLDYCRAEGIDHIDDYVSDIQGMDLTVLKTLKPLIEARKISTITCEVAKDARRNLYSDLPDNGESGFAELLKDNYQLVATGWGALDDGHFDVVPDSWWEMDQKWRLKDLPR
jgi:FkbM family methyltransferase